MKWERKYSPETFLQKMDNKLRGWLSDRPTREDVVTAVLLEAATEALPKDMSNGSERRDQKTER